MAPIVAANGASSEVLVLCYHAVSPTWEASLAVTPKAVERQLTMLVERGFKGAKFTEAVLHPPHRRTLAVTFDDAYLSVLERAEPILSRLGLVATVFVPTEFMDRRQRLVWTGIDRWAATPFADELQGMCWDDLRSLQTLGWEVGSHTRTHPRLTDLDEDAAYAQLADSRLDCEWRLGARCTSVAYPYGDVDDRTVRLAREAGYVAGARLSSSLIPNGSLRWPRVGVYHEDNRWRSRAKLNVVVRRIRAHPRWPAHE
jgi:peptidoglycan/xylan/chitin deacetylase (PgdA/CDA1 family)